MHTPAAQQAQQRPWGRHGLREKCVAAVGALAATMALAAVSACTIGTPGAATTVPAAPEIVSQTSTTSSSYSYVPSGELVDSQMPLFSDGVTAADLTQVDQAQWTINLGEVIPGAQLGNLGARQTGTDELTAPIQVGDVMLVGLKSSHTEDAGVAAFSMADGSLLWQDRSLECNRVDVGGALLCRHNNGSWMPFNPARNAGGDAIDPGFAPEAFTFRDGVLYTAGQRANGDLAIAAGSLLNPTELWDVTIPRAAECIAPGEGASMEVSGDRVVATVGVAGGAVSVAGEVLTPLATGTAQYPISGGGFLSKPCGGEDIQLLGAGNEVLRTLPAADVVIPGVRMAGNENHTLISAAALIDGLNGADVATFAAPAIATSTLRASQIIGDVTIVYGLDDTLVGYGPDNVELWRTPLHVLTTPAVTNGNFITYVAEVAGAPALVTLDVHTGAIVRQQEKVAGDVAPSQIQSARAGFFAYDSQAGTISYYHG